MAETSKPIIDCMEKSREEKVNGDVGLVFHVRNGKVEWIERINGTTE